MKIRLTKKHFELIFIISMLLTIILEFLFILIPSTRYNATNIFFSHFEDFWADFTNVVGYSGHRDPYHHLIYTGLGEKAYPPLNYVIGYIYSTLVNIYYYDFDSYLPLFHEPLLLLAILFTLVTLTILFFELLCNMKTGNKLTKVLVASCFLLSFPVQFTVERGNFLYATVIFMIIFVLYYESENKILRELAYISLAIAAGLKLSPALLGFLLIDKRMWKETFRTVIYGLLFFILPFLLLKGGLSNIPQMFSNMSSNFALYPSYTGCTLTAALCGFGIEATQTNMSIIKVLSYIIAIMLFAFTFIVKKEWQKVLLLSLIIVMIPAHSGTYNIIYYIPAFVLFLNDEEHSIFDVFILIGSLLCLYPLWTPLRNILSFNLGQIIILIIMLIEGGISVHKRLSV